MSSRFSSTAIFLGLMASIMMSSSQAAKIYHWVDENGRSHYSENLPHNTEAKALTIKATGKGSAGSASITQADTKAQKATTKENTEKTLVVEYSPAEQAKYCQQSRDLLQSMNGNTQRRFKQEDGSYRKFEQSEITDYQSQANEGIKNYCK
jgi:hypothetical protein